MDTLSKEERILRLEKMIVHGYDGFCSAQYFAFLRAKYPTEYSFLLEKHKEHLISVGREEWYQSHKKKI
jgi:hypothetical protein